MSSPNLDDLKRNGDVPEWMTIEGYETLSRGYLLAGETPRTMYLRLARAAAKTLKRPDLEAKFFNIFWKNWLCPASPVAANLGTERGLPISCYGMTIPDSVDGIMSSMHEISMLSKNGGGIGTYWGDVRARGSAIKGNGVSDGIVPFLKIQDSVTIGISQGGTRRGASSAYLPVEHGDFDEFIEMRRPKGDLNRQCLNIHHAVSIGDEFMQKVVDGDKESRRRWKHILKSRFETGEPYLFFRDNADRMRPQWYKDLGLDVKTSQLCSEILLHTDEHHTFVCCLSSLNAARWDEWKDTDTVQLAIWFLDAVMEEFIQKTANLKGFERAHAFSVKSRALGLGILGFHTLLQQRMIPFDCMETHLLNLQMFKFIRAEAEIATKALAEAFGEPEWCKGYGRRNTHLLAIAPTVSNSLISGNVSAGIEPWAANAFAQKSAKGTFLQKNRQLEALLDSKGKNNSETWKHIVNNNGSVQGLDFLSEDEKNVFLTARELNQYVLVRLAAARQRHIDQGQSLNLFFPANTDTKYLNKVHIEAWSSGLATLYYCRTSSVLKGDSGSRSYYRSASECTMCEG
jgi:ribonucleoside-diphosphate reductase alpha chain